MQCTNERTTVDMTIYFNAINTIKKELNLDSEASYLTIQLKYLENYLDQCECVQNVNIFDYDPSDENLLDEEEKCLRTTLADIQIEKTELKTKLIGKLNNLISEKFEEIQRIL